MAELKFMSGGGEMGERIRAHSWSETPFGAPESWSPALRSAVSICLNSAFPTAIYWGPELRLLYNDAWSTIPAERHPWALGQPASEVWVDIWPIVGPQFVRVLSTGEGFSVFDQMLPMQRGGRVYETYWTYSFTPVRDEDGEIVGVLNQGNETTDRILGQRRQDLKLKVEEALRRNTEPRAMMSAAAEILGRHLRADRVGCGELNPEDGTALVELYWSELTGSKVGSSLSVDLTREGVARQQAGLAEYSDDVTKDPRHDPRAWSEKGARAYASVPLMRHGRFTACFYVDRREPHPWSLEDISILDDISSRTWAAVERVRAEDQRWESETRFRNLADHAPVMMWVTDPTGACTYLNRLWYEFTGQTAEEAEGFGWLEATHPDDRERAQQVFSRANAARQAFRLDYRLRRYDGTYHWAIDAAAPRFGQSGEFLGYVGSVIDIDERRRMESALRESEERLRLAAQAAQIGTWDLDLVTGTGHWDEAAVRIGGLPGPRTYDTRTWLRLVHPDDRAMADAAFMASLETDGESYELEFRGAAPAEDGGPRWLTSHGTVLRDPVTRQPVRAVGIVRDITMRHRRQQRLHESEARLRTLTDAVPAFVWFATPDGQLQFFNERWYEYTGQTEAEALADGWAAMLHPDDAERTALAWLEARANGRTYEIEVRYRRRDGEYRWYVARAEPLKSAGGEITSWFGTSTDIHDRKLSEARLQDLNDTLERRVQERTADLMESQRRFRGIFDSALQFMALLTPAGTVVEVNRTALAWSRITASDIVGKPFWLAAPMRGNLELQATVKAGIERAARGETVRSEQEMRGADDVRAIVDFSLKPVLGDRGEAVWLVAEGRDITELKRTQDALRQAQKMEAIGQLTGGVAHDFNNLLTIIRSSIDLLRRPGLGEDRRRRYFDAIADTVDRAAKLTGQLLAFARRQALKPEVFDPAQRIRSVADMLRTLVGGRIEIVVEIGCESCFVEADASQFETALVNMALNARDAMAEEGRLIVRVDEIDDIPPATRTAPASKRLVAVSLSDTGIGIPPEAIDQIFEPFFTTKDVGKGTGLGLSQVFGFAKQSGGDVTVRSEVGQGTTFTLYLPRYMGPMPGEAVAPSASVAVLDANGRGRRVLVVEDNADVGQFSTQILQDLGYQTTWAADADEALRLLETTDGFDAVFSDVVMPGTSGVELGLEIRRRYPGLPVVLTSGYSHILAEEGSHGFDLVKKPYAAEELSRVLRKVTRSRASDR